MKFKNFILNHKWKFISGILLVALAFIFLGGNGNDGLETVMIEPRPFVRNVSVAGKVVPAEEVELGFDRGGRIAAVYKDTGESVRAGETIAVLSSGDVSADLAKAEADLLAEKARLAELKNANSTSFGTELDINEEKLRDALANAYTTADDVVRNNVDQVYDDSNKIYFAFNDYDLRQELNNTRREIGYMLKNWSLNRSDVGLAESNLDTLKNFLERVALAVNDFQVEGSAFNQADIDKFKSDISSARSEVNQAIQEINSAKDSVRSSESEIPFQEAKVKAAEAAVDRLRADLGKNVITAPFNGVVTNQDAKVGEIVSASTPLTKIISNQAFQIETFVPEINIGEVAVGNIAKVTLDAYGKEMIFEARVVSIDPAETLRDGVSTYKTKFEFISEDERFRSGMTANVLITTQEKPESIVISQDSVVRKNGFTFVKVLVGDEVVEKQITLGSVATDGDVEVVSGLSIGEKVVLKPDIVKE